MPHQPKCINRTDQALNFTVKLLAVQCQPLVGSAEILHWYGLQILAKLCSISTSFSYDYLDKRLEHEHHIREQSDRFRTHSLAPYYHSNIEHGSHVHVCRSCRKSDGLCFIHRHRCITPIADGSEHVGFDCQHQHRDQC